jgi:hypothetical protein
MLLLKYHDIEVYSLLKRFDIEPEAFATGWILTNFSRVLSFGIIHEMIDIVLHE